MTENEKYALLVNILIPTLAAIVAAWVSIVVSRRQSNNDRDLLVLELSENQAREDKKEADRINNKLSYFSWLLNNIIKYATEQNDNYKKLVAGVSSDILGFHPLVTIASSDAKRIFSLNQEDIFQAVTAVAGKGIYQKEKIRKLYSKLDYTLEIIDDIKDKFSGHRLEVHNLSLSYRQHVENMREKVVEIMSKIKADAPDTEHDNELFMLLNDTIGFYSTNVGENTNLEWTHKNFVRHLQENLVKDFRGLDEVQPLLIEGRRASILIGQIRFSVKGIIDDLTHYNQELSKNLKELKDDYDFLTSFE